MQVFIELIPDDGQQPEDVFVDGLIALCSTTQPQLKPLISHAFESCCERVGKGGFSVLFQAILKPDTQYLKEEGEDDEEGEEGQDQENGEETGGEEGEEEEDEVDDDANLLGKRPAKNETQKPEKNDKTPHKKSGDSADHKHHNGKSKVKVEQTQTSGKKEKKAKA